MKGCEEGKERSIEYHSTFGGWWRISWTMTRHINGKCLDFKFSRDVCDREAVKKWCEKWGLEFPES